MKYRKKPIIIEATQFFVWMDKCDWPEEVKERIISGDVNSIHGAEVEFYIETLEGPLRVSNEDFIITGIKGEKYPCKPDIFLATYDLVE